MADVRMTSYDMTRHAALVVLEAFITMFVLNDGGWVSDEILVPSGG